MFLRLSYNEVLEQKDWVRKHALYKVTEQLLFEITQEEYTLLLPCVANQYGYITL